MGWVLQANRVSLVRVQAVPLVGIVAQMVEHWSKSKQDPAARATVPFSFLHGTPGWGRRIANPLTSGSSPTPCLVLGLVSLHSSDGRASSSYVESPWFESRCSDHFRGVAQSGSASALGAEGRRFESCRPDLRVLVARLLLGSVHGFKE